MAKPFSPREVVLRVQSILRRAGPISRESRHGGLYTDGPLKVDVAARRATFAGSDVALTVREFDLLAHFVAHPDVVFSRDELLATVWGWQYGDASTVTVHVKRLRSKLDLDGTGSSQIVTVWGRGYRWCPAVAR